MYKRITLLTLYIVILPVTVLASNYTEYTYEHPTENNYHVGATALSDDGAVAVTIGGTGVTADTELVIFTADKEKPAWKFQDTNGHVIFDVAISGDGSTIVGCGGAIWVLDVPSEKLLWTYEPNTFVWDTCAISDDGNTIVAGNRDALVQTWQRSSNTVLNEWTMPKDRFMNSVSLNDDGSLILATNDRSYALYNTVSGETIWKKTTKVDVYLAWLNEADGSEGVMILDDGKTGTSDYWLRGVNMKTGKLTWSKRFSSYNTPRVRMSHNGKRIVLTTNKIYYGINAETGKTVWTFRRDDNSDSSLDISDDAKFLGVSEGLDYIYLFDWDYPRSKKRPFQINSGIFPGAVGLSADGSTFGYEHTDFTYEQIAPGILVDTQNIPIYSSGDDMKLRFHVSNPGHNANLKIKTSLSLPQVATLSDLGASVSGEPASVKNKLLDYANTTLPGYEVADKRSVMVAAHDSETIQATIEVPEMILPDWLGDLLELIGLDDLLSTLLGDYAEPLNDLVNNEVNDTLIDGTNDAVGAGEAVYAMLGVGQVELYDADTNDVYSTDTFYFMYLVL